VNVVAVVPVPGATVPSSTVIVPHVLARTGVANPARDAANQIVGATTPTRSIRIRCRWECGKDGLPVVDRR
jgi:hypothetical protein